MKNIWIVIQARTSSQRLPQKVIKKIAGMPLISHVIRRTKFSKYGKNVCLATTHKKEDNILEDIGKREGVYVFRGDNEDVLARFYFAAQKLSAHHIIRITGDCPLIDPQIIERVTDIYMESKVDYASNIHPSTFPDGLDVEIMSTPSLERAYKEAKMKYQREHVTPFIWENKNIFKMINYFNKKENLNYMRWVVDEEVDLRFVREIYRRVNPGGGKIFYMEDILEVLKEESHLQKINAGIIRNEGFLKSLKEEKLI